jgi:hypothetical protein
MTRATEKIRRKVFRGGLVLSFLVLSLWCQILSSGFALSYPVLLSKASSLVFSCGYLVFVSSCLIDFVLSN